GSLVRTRACLTGADRRFLRAGCFFTPPGICLACHDCPSGPMDLSFMSTLTTEAALGGESFADLFAASIKDQNMRSGEVISAEVVRVDHNFVVVNAGLKSEAYIPLEEFLNDQGDLEVQSGDFVSVAIDSLENGYGDTILSRDRAKRLSAWLHLEQALESGELVNGTITGKVKGGLTVMTNGIRAFPPGSLVDLRPVKDTSDPGRKARMPLVMTVRPPNGIRAFL